MSEFIKKVKKDGNVRNIDEAFKEYPVEEEVHQGNFEYYVAEKIIKYGKYNIGDIVFVSKYKYESGLPGKEHLFVIIDKDNRSVPLEYFGLLISSNLKKLKYKSNKLLEKNNKNNLIKNSLVKCDAIYVVKEDSIVGKIGKVDIELIEKYKQIYNNMIE